MIGERLRKARKASGLLQVELAAAMGDRYDSGTISRVETGKSSLRLDGLVNAAKELKVSTDYLLGLTDDPALARQRSTTDPRAIAESKADYDPSSYAPTDRSPVRLLEVASVAGVGAEVYDETPVGLLWFRNDWLQTHAIDPEESNIISARGHSMEPTLPDGCSILVDRKRREPQEGRIYVMRTEEGLVVKRLGLDDQGRWEIRSDNPDWEPALMLYATEIIGEARWYGVTL